MVTGATVQVVYQSGTIGDMNQSESKRPARLVTVIGILLAALGCMFLWFIGQNEYVFPSWGRFAAVGLGAVVGLSFRLRRKRSGHTVAWITFVLGLYNWHMILAGYLYLGFWAILVFPAVGAATVPVFRRRTIMWRLLAAGILVVFVGAGLFLRFNTMLLVDKKQFCSREAVRLPGCVATIAAQPLHPYDFGGVPGAGKVGVGYGFEEKIYMLDLASNRLERGASIPTGVQRVTPHPNGQLLALPPWGHWGEGENVNLVDAQTGQLYAKAPVPDCSNMFEIAFAGERMYVLCESSHSLHELSAESPFGHLRSLELPGMDSYDLAIDAAGEKAYVTDWLSPNLAVVDLAAMRVTGKLRIGWSSFGVAFGPDGNLYVSQPLLRRVLVVDVNELRIIRTIKAGYGPRDLAFDSTRDLLFIANYFDGTVDMVRMRDGSRLRRIFVGSLARGLWFDSERDRLLAAAGCGIREVRLSLLFD